MSFLDDFLQIARWRPGQALIAFYWRALGKRVRARNHLARTAQSLPIAYHMWITKREEAIVDEPRRAHQQAYQPIFTVVPMATAANTKLSWTTTLTSVLQQRYQSFEVMLPAEASGSDKSTDERICRMTVGNILPNAFVRIAAEQACGDYLLVLEAGSILTPLALSKFAHALQESERPDILYGDQDRLTPHGDRTEPWLKPCWDREMLLSQDYVSSCYAISTKLAREVLNSNQISPLVPRYDLLLTASADQKVRVQHVPWVMTSLQKNAKPEDTAARIDVISQHLGTKVDSVLPGSYSSVKVQWKLPSPAPMVSIIVPTRDKVELLRACVTSILTLTDYPNFEIIVINNNSEEEETISYLEELKLQCSLRVLDYNLPYNYSAINNFAAYHALGDFLCLLNNDTEVISSEWLAEMVRHAARPHVGAVGAKLLYEDRSIQHAGVVIGMGNAAGHAHRFLPNNDPGYFAQAHIARSATAVTAACLVVAKTKYTEVGGLDEKDLSIAYNDVDFCLKLRAAGYTNIYTPEAVLYHHESKSRGSDFSSDNLERYMKELTTLQERWNTKKCVDPTHHPALDRASETYVLHFL